MRVDDQRAWRRWAWPALIGVAITAILVALLGASCGDKGAGPRETLTATAAPPTPTSWPRRRLPSPGFGLEVYLWWDEQAARRDLRLVKDAGFNWIKQHVGWRDVEGTAKGHFDWYFTDRIVSDAEQLGLNVIFRLDSEPVWAISSEGTSSGNGPPEDPQDFGDFCHALADRYRGRVQAYQVWNEPNLAREWGGRTPDPVGYVELLRSCYLGVKSADADALVISAGLSPTGNGPPEAIPDAEYLVAMYEAGAGPYFDLLGVHAPGFQYEPEISPDEVAARHDGHRFFCFRRVEDLREIMLQYDDGEKQVAVLEMGWTIDPVHPDYAWFAVTPEQQADYLVRAFAYARQNWSPWVGPMIVISIADPSWTGEDEQYWWAITEPGWPDAHLRPAYLALRDMEK